MKGKLVSEMGMVMKQVLHIRSLLLVSVFCVAVSAQAQELKPGITQQTPSIAHYFSWVNHNLEGATEAQTLANLEFFQWMHDEYGMQLDIYNISAGTMDGGTSPYPLVNRTFDKKFPNGFGAVSKKAAQMNTRLGVWGTPDGFGNTPEETATRIETIVSLFRDHNFRLLQYDAGADGLLREDKYDTYFEMLSKCKEYCPDLVILDHRLPLGPKVKDPILPMLPGVGAGVETYIDVHQINRTTAAHHRAQAMRRGVPSDLSRLYDDHGVCFNSCLDYWEDDLILQVFNRAMAFAPSLYGSPWFLRDNEYPYLAFIFNLHREYRDILIKGKILPKEQYGYCAVSRGDETTRFITLRNMSWTTKSFSISLGKEIGIEKGKKVQVRQYHPYIYDMGLHAVGGSVKVEVLPFRAALVKVTTAAEKDAVTVSGIPYHIVRNVPGKPIEVKLLGMPGESYDVSVQARKGFKLATLDAKANKRLASGGTETVAFGGEKLKEDFMRHLASMQEGADLEREEAQALFYATCYAGDSNALEVRSLLRSGETSVPQVQKARDAFFEKQLFIDKGLWDKNMFDGDSSTAFRTYQPYANSRCAFLLDVGKVQHVDKLVIECPNVYSIFPLQDNIGVWCYVSADLRHWDKVRFVSGTRMEIDLSKIASWRYFRLDNSPLAITEVAGYRAGEKVDRQGWRGSNMFFSYESRYPSWNNTNPKVWKAEFTLEQIPAGSYLCVAVEGTHGGGYRVLPGFKIDGKYVGAPDRAPSYNFNPWEINRGATGGNHTFYLPLTEEMKGKKIEAYLLAPKNAKAKPEIYMAAYPIPFDSKTLVLK